MWSNYHKDNWGGCYLKVAGAGDPSLRTAKQGLTFGPRTCGAGALNPAAARRGGVDGGATDARDAWAAAAAACAACAAAVVAAARRRRAAAASDAEHSGECGAECSAEYSRAPGCAKGGAVDV